MRKPPTFVSFMNNKSLQNGRLTLPAKFITTLLLSTYLAIPILAQPVDPQNANANLNQPAENEPLTASEQAELQLYLRSLRNEKLELTDRVEFGKLLLSKNWNNAALELAQDLTPENDITTLRAIVKAIAATETPPKPLIPNLLSLLKTKDNQLRKDVATALAQYDDITLQLKLINSAMDKAADPQVRIGSIYALAEYRSKEVVGRLMQLIDEPQAAIRQAAFTSLTELTGHTEHGNDPHAWHQWWADKRTMSQQRFLTSIVRSISARSNEMTARQTKLIEKIVKEKRAHYLNVVDEKRIPLVLEMLKDELAEVRILAANLASGRVVNAQEITPELLTALRDRFNDLDPRVRAAVAIPLGDLGDETAAKFAIERLEQETEPTVQAAYLILLAQVPQPGAVNPALKLFTTPDLTHAAATALAAAYDADLLSETQTDNARTAARNHLTDRPKPEPAVIRLLGRIGTELDHDIIVQQLDHEDPQIRLAAAEAFNSGRLPLDPILQRLADDTTLAPIAIAIATKHGKTAATILTLLSNKPKDTKLTSTWTESIVEIHKRLTTPDHLIIDLALADQEVFLELREALLKFATAKPTTNTFLEQQHALTLNLAQLYLNTRRPAQAKTLFDQLATQNVLPPEKQSVLKLGQLEAYLRSGEVDDAVGIATKIIMDNKDLPADEQIDQSQMIERFITVAKAAANDNQLPRARSIVSSTRKLFKDKLTADEIKLLNSLVTATTPTVE